jgi:biopolymer transport protein ExbD
MFIITIPIQTHAVKLDLPSCKDCPIVDALKNELAITREGVLLWNRTPVTEAQLRYNLAASVRMPKQPELHLRPDPESRYEVVDQVLADIKEEKVTKVGFVGNEDYHW